MAFREYIPPIEVSFDQRAEASIKCKEFRRSKNFSQNEMANHIIRLYRRGSSATAVWLIEKGSVRAPGWLVMAILEITKPPAIDADTIL